MPWRCRGWSPVRSPGKSYSAVEHPSIQSKVACSESIHPVRFTLKNVSI